MFLHMSVILCTGGRGLCIMSLPVWLPGPMFLLQVFVSGPMFLPGVSVQGVSVQGGLYPCGLCPGCPGSEREVFARETLRKRPPYGKERAVRILLECILVMAVCLVPFFVGPLTFELVGSSVLTSVDCVSGTVCFAVAVSIFLLQTKKKHGRKIDFLNSQLAL